MAEDLWGGFAETIQIEKLAFGAEPVRKPSAQSLDAYERQTEFRLPKSYRQFLLTFGPGTLGHDFRIASPSYPPRELNMRTIEELNEFYKETQTDDVLEEFCNDPERAKRLILFCRTESDFIGWDPLEVTDRRRHECAVYTLQYGYTLARVAGSFREFVEDYCLEDSDIYLRFYGPWDEEERGPRRVFEPAAAI